MKTIYLLIERRFEKLTSVASAIMGNSITFIIALLGVLCWLGNSFSYKTDIHASFGELILGIAFLSLFIIQKSFNRFSASIQLKLNELVASHEPASNKLINVEIKTEIELTELSREYTELAVLANALDEKAK